MTYAPPEGVSIGDFTADTLPASFNAPVGAGISYKIYGTAAGVGTATSEGEPEGYKIPILNTSGVTENLWDEEYENISINLLYKSLNVGDGEFTLSTTTPIYSGSCCLFLMAGQQTSGATTSGDGASANLSRTVTSVDGYVTVAYRKYGTVDPRDYQTMLTKGSTPPDHYIPHRYESNYDLFIGDTKLGAEEYVDYADQKIYKMSGSTLVPTDPPAPLPAINTYKGENTISSTETLGDVELTGEWSAIMGSTQSESIDIEFTVDAEEYIAFVTVDDGPLTQVSDTITMPSSADSFSLEVVAWGRERYTDTVYNALS